VSASLATLNGIPRVDLAENLRQAARVTRRGFASLVAEVLVLRRGPGKLASSEYFTHRLWEPSLSRADRLAFVGKQAQERMHRACNDMAWLAPAADKLLFHTVMTGAGLATPELLAVIHPSRVMPGVPSLRSHDAMLAFLRDPATYPLFAKPIGGKYSLNVHNVDAYRSSTDKVTLCGGEELRIEDLARLLVAGDDGFLLQRRLSPPGDWTTNFGPRLCSVRVVVHLTTAGASVHRAVLKLATGNNPADNFWRAGNMLGAVDVRSGRVQRVVAGTGLGMTVDAPHPDTGRPIIGTLIPDWQCLTSMVETASQLFPGIRTQSWDIAIADRGMVPLEVNWGGDLNLAQLAYGAGVLDDDYRRHLRSCGYRFRAREPKP